MTKRAGRISCSLFFFFFFLSPRKVFGQELQRDETTEVYFLSLVDDAHPPSFSTMR